MGILRVRLLSITQLPFHETEELTQVVNSFLCRSHVFISLALRQIFSRISLPVERRTATRQSPDRFSHTQRHTASNRRRTLLGLASKPSCTTAEPRRCTPDVSLLDYSRPNRDSCVDSFIAIPRQQTLWLGHSCWSRAWHYLCIHWFPPVSPSVELRGRMGVGSAEP